MTLMTLNRKQVGIVLSSNNCSLFAINVINDINVEET